MGDSASDRVTRVRGLVEHMGESTTAPCVTPQTIPDELVVDRVHAMLADAHRRQVLAALESAGSATPLPELARIVARSEGAVDADAVERVHLRLYHVHVPKLAAAGYVGYDEQRDVVELTDRGATIAGLLED